MTAPKSAYFVFPDFQPFIDRLVISRSAIETDRGQVVKARPDLTGQRHKISGVRASVSPSPLCAGVTASTGRLFDESRVVARA